MDFGSRRITIVQKCGNLKEELILEKDQNEALHIFNIEARGCPNKNVLQELGDREFEVRRKVGLFWIRS